MVNKKEIKKSAAVLARRIILGLSIIAVIVCAIFLIKSYIIEPYNNRNNNDAGDIDESNSETSQYDGSEDAVQSKYIALLNVNPDFVGKLYIDAIDEGGLNIVQTTDNSKYLTTGFKGENTRYGTLFVDYRNDIKDFDDNTIIYGHNMRDGSQLGSLSLYSDIENYKLFPTIRFNTIYKNYTWKVFAAFIINSQPEDDNGYAFPYLTTNFPSDASFNDFISDVKSRSYYINEAVDIKPDDKILTLSTCDTAFDDARFVLMARLVRDGESETVDVSKAKVNENQKFPQSWYDEKGETNPFKNAEQYHVK